MTILPVDGRPLVWNVEMALKAVTYFGLESEAVVAL